MYFRSAFIAVLVAFAVAAPKKDNKAKKECGGKPAEIFFLLDSSSSIWSVDFTKQLQFVNAVIDTFEVSPTKTRVGVASFSYRFHENVELDTFDDKEDLKEAVKNIRQYYGGTYTYDALDGVRTRGLSASGVRPGVVRIAIVITDGESYNEKKTKEAAKKLKDEGVVVFAIGIGSRTDRGELTAIASEPSDEFLFEVGNYGLLDTIKDTFAVEACKVEVQDAEALGPKCGANNPADVMFLVDPAEIGSADSKLIFDFISELSEEFNMEKGNMQVGLEARNCGADNINLGEYGDKTELAKAFRNTKLPGMSHMIKRLRNHYFKKENGGRMRARHMAVIFVDDRLHNAKEVLDEARRTKNDDVELFVVAIGDSVVEDELMALCSSPVRRHFIRVASYDDLTTSKKTFLDQFCVGL